MQYAFIFLVGYFISDFKTTISMLGIIGLVYLGFWIKTIRIKKKYKYYEENGTKYNGMIKDIKVVTGRRGPAGDKYTIVYLVVEYKNPYTNKIEQITTESVNGNPFIYLSSLDVTVYVLKDGKALVTDFKKIKKLTDSVKCQTDEKYRNGIESQERNRFENIFYYILFFLIMAIIFKKR